MDWNSPLLLSLRIAFFSTLIVVITGLPTAVWIMRRSDRVRPFLESFVLLPLLLPPTVVGYYLLCLIAPGTAVGRAIHTVFNADLVFTWYGAVIAAGVGSFPLFVRQAQTALAAVPKEIEEVSLVFGCSRWQTFRHILLPLSKAGIVAGVCLGFCRALGDFGATLMVAGNTPGKTQTLSLAVWDSLMSGDSEAAGRMSFGLAAVGIIVTVCVGLLTQRGSREK